MTMYAATPVATGTDHLSDQHRNLSSSMLSSSSSSPAASYENDPNWKLYVGSESTTPISLNALSSTSVSPSVVVTEQSLTVDVHDFVVIHNQTLASLLKPVIISLQLGERQTFSATSTRFKSLENGNASFVIDKKFVFTIKPSGSATTDVVIDVNIKFMDGSDLGKCLLPFKLTASGFPLTAAPQNIQVLGMAGEPMGVLQAHLSQSISEVNDYNNA